SGPRRRPSGSPACRIRATAARVGDATEVTTMRPTRPLPGLAAWLLVAGSLAAPAHAVTLCARSGNGADPNDGATVKVRSACKDTETALDPATLGLSAPGVSTIVRTGDQITTNGSVSTPASCEAGEVATGGGALSVGNDGGVAVLRSSRPQPETAGA